MKQSNGTAEGTIRVLFLGAPVDPLDRNDLTLAERFERSGRNTGNLLIGCALRRQIACSSYAYGNTGNPERANDEFDLIAIPAANFIYPGFDFGWLADFIERTDLPCLVVGLGAQAPSVATSTLDLPRGTRRFLDVVADRTATLGVRGAFTAEVLAKLGITNVALIGCPSLYLSLEPEISVDKKPYSDDLRVTVNGSRNVTSHSYAVHEALRIEGALLRMAMRRGYDYVLQNEFPELEVLHADAVDDAAAADLMAIAKQLRLGVDATQYATFVKEKCRAFFSVESWRDYMRTKDFSVGTRFHGNLIALLSGVPAAVFVHDTRTRELCELAAIPHYALGAARPDDLQALYEELAFADFSRNYSNLYAAYVDFFVDNGVPHNLTLPVQTAVR